MFFASFFGGGKIFSPPVLCKGELTLPRGGKGSAPWGHCGLESCLGLAHCHWLGSLLRIWPPSPTRTWWGAPASPADLCPKDKGLHGQESCFLLHLRASFLSPGFLLPQDGSQAAWPHGREKEEVTVSLPCSWLW